jgi:hypothetical protein
MLGTNDLTYGTPLKGKASSLARNQHSKVEKWLKAINTLACYGKELITAIKKSAVQCLMGRYDTWHYDVQHNHTQHNGLKSELNIMSSELRNSAKMTYMWPTIMCTLLGNSAKMTYMWLSIMALSVTTLSITTLSITAFSTTLLSWMCPIFSVIHSVIMPNVVILIVVAPLMVLF